MNSRVWQAAAWALCLPLVILGWVLLSPTLPLTVLVELLLAAGYARIRKKDWPALAALVLIGNLITQVGLWLVLHKGMSQNYWSLLAVSEVIIWLLEALLYYWPLRSNTSLREALGMSLLFNSISFGLGLFLPY